MLFRKKMTRVCELCIHGTKLNEDEILCIKKGIRSCDSKCMQFRYDPCKRIPAKAKAMDFSKYDKEDFSL